MKGFNMIPLRDIRNPWRHCQLDDLIERLDRLSLEDNVEPTIKEPVSHKILHGKRKNLKVFTRMRLAKHELEVMQDRMMWGMQKKPLQIQVIICIFHIIMNRILLLLMNQLILKKQLPKMI